MFSLWMSNILKIFRLIGCYIDKVFSSRDSEILDSNWEKGTNSSAIIFCSYRDLESELITNIGNIFNAKKFDFLHVINLNHRLTDKDYQKLKFKSNSKVFLRNNFGYDLSAYRDVFNLVEKNYQNVFLINDSVDWNWSELSSICSTSLKKPGIHVMTNSIQPYLHYQTFFIAAVGSSAKSEMKNWLCSLKNYRLKDSAVLFGELKTSKYLTPVEIKFSYEDLILEQSRNKTENWDLVTSEMFNRNLPLNPSYHFPETLNVMGFPGKKIKNYYNDYSGTSLRNRYSVFLRVETRIFINSVRRYFRL